MKRRTPIIFALAISAGLFGSNFVVDAVTRPLSADTQSEQDHDMEDSFHEYEFETIGGRIVDIELTENAGGSRGMHLILDFGKKVRILLGPERYLTEAGFTPAKGDRVSIVGLLVKKGDVPEVVAYTVDWNGKTFHLRDQESGKPTWSGGN